MRNNLLILFLMTMLPGIISAQNSDHALSGWKLSAYFSPDHSYRTLKGDGDNAKTLINMRDSLESPRFGFTAGLGLDIPLNHQLSLNTGIAISDKGEKFEQKSFQPIGSDPILENLDRVESIHHYYFLEIPANIQYYLINGNKLDLYAKGGISFNFFLDYRSSSTYFYQDGSEEEFEGENDIDGFRTLSLGAMAAMGINYQLTSQLSLRAEPIFKHGFTSITETELKVYPYSLGVNVGVAYKL